MMWLRLRQVMPDFRPGAGLLSRMLVVAVFALGALGCASDPLLKKEPGSRIQWPVEPARPRIVWEKEVRTPHDAGMPKGFWQNLGGFFFGETAVTIGKPYGVHAADGGNVLYIVDVGRSVVHVFDRREKKHWTIGRGKNDRREFTSPIGVTTDGKGYVYVTDSGKGMVFRCRLSDGTLEPFITKGIQRPTGIAFNRRKNLLYVSDTLAHQVLVYTLDGRLSFRIGSRGTEEGEFNFPTDLFVDSAGWLYITDAINNRIQIFYDDGRFHAMFGQAGDAAGYFAKPKGVGVDSDGNIYVVDALFDSVQIFDRKGQLLLDFGGHGTGPGQLWLPSGIHVGEDDTIYVADTYNQRVQVFRYLKQSTEAGKQ